MTSTVEIAEIAGVSQATVSRVINNHAGVSPETVQIVNEIIKRLGYEPRPRKARREGGGQLRVKNVAVLMLDGSSQRHPTLAMAKLRGVEQALSAAGMNMILADVSSKQASAPALERRQLDGVLLWGHRASKKLMEKLTGIPAVWLSSHVSSSDGAVSQGNAAIGRLAGEYLLQRDLDRLCFLTVKSDHPGFAARGDGFGYAAHLQGVEIERYESDQDPPFEQMSSRQLEAAVAPLVEGMLRDPRRPIGLFAPDDQITAAIYRQLHRAKIEIGREINVVSCNNEEPYLAGLHPRPATIDLAPELTGRRAVEQLLWSMRRPDDTDRRMELIVEPILIEGDALPESE
ncbi:LacI family DNA-binding transcriptional regulator [Blastopirellula retiformator]|uniref:Ribose operon repressor n=1 Tax=Blastopirellula retiformator TaxID=2527970 RepID=A0A5C5V9V2_9BACT|nr:LacI family DNA-binding transcriptional regulator [Blastopirellula retiformator]TWT34667.1 Ribose operon repressor [Blastopirellula retiformator]